MKIDFHTHCDFSNDSKTPMEEMIKGAMALGITDLAFTDHVDYDYDENGIVNDWAFDVPQYMATIEQLQMKYDHKIKLYRAAEVGIQPHLAERNNLLIKSHPFDFIIASLHTVDLKDLYYKKYFQSRTDHESIRDYYESFYQSILQMDDFSVLGHLDLYLRYWAPLLEIPVKNYFDQIEPLLKWTIEKERGIEINSGGYFRYGLGRNNPCDDILKLFKSLNGEVITLGSDAHSPEHLGTLYQENLQRLDDLGFKYVCTFKDRLPQYHSIKKLL